MEGRDAEAKIHSGFRNIKPKTRAERRAMTDKVALEKARLMARTGPSARMYRDNLPDWEMGLTAMKPGAAGWLSDADRFHTDTSGEEYLARQKEVIRKQEMYNRRRVEVAEREEARWKRIEEAKAVEEERVKIMRMAGTKSKKNASYLPYNMLTLQYNDDLEGERQRHSDNMVRYRAQLRAQNLEKWGGSRSGYNILSGADHAKMVPPEMPRPGEHLYLAEEQKRRFDSGDMSVINQSSRPSEMVAQSRGGPSGFSLG